MNRDGIAYLHLSRSKEQEIPSNLFTGFLSAIQNIASDSIDAIKMKDTKVMIFPRTGQINFFVIGRTSVKEKDKDIRKHLEKISEMFLEQYGTTLQDWDGEISIFESFEEKLNKMYIKKEEVSEKNEDRFKTLFN